MKAIEHARRHLASLSPEHRAQLENEWKGVPRMTQELKACPFCGGEAYTTDSDNKWFVSCHDCYACVGEGYDADAWPDHMFYSKAEAIAAWNTRTPDSVIAELVEAARDLIARKSDTYTARNGRKMGIQADDGEKCFIIHSDAVFFLESAIAKLEASK